MHLKCEKNDLFLSPTMHEICNAFHIIVDHISYVGQQLPPLDSWVGAKIKRDYIKVILPEWYLAETYRRLTEALENAFRPFTDYVKSLHEKFKIVFDPETIKSIVVYVRTGHSFQEYVEKVEYFNESIREINGMVN
ncbi:uncharacterized protein LOC113464851 [Ceratina calcarata]|uniref:Uncharacterized protein LOC113464851 n=1 Tax=Ceratina calcarata TaxID=156304 RepID=A0AAJ7S810_9HYME|nr:uncharacterized protein LOC113464851 [Ceratina calcarata]